jgi:hypothetical protein
LVITMDDLRERFETLDRVPVPNLWNDVERRLEALGTLPPTPRRVAVRTDRRPATSVHTRPSRALLVAAALLATVLIAGGLAVGGALIRLPAVVAPSPDRGASPLPTSTEPVATSAPARVPAGWTAAGSMSASRVSHTSTVLADGKVLVVGGCVDCRVLGAADLYDPATRTWSETGRLATERRFHTASLLGDGTVLVAGGMDPRITAITETVKARSLDSVELFDPHSGTWTAGEPMVTARFFHTATVLSDGSVLVAGGVEAGPGVPPDESSYGGRALNSAELYDPSTRTWTATGAMTRPREGHAAVLLADGRVLVFGGATKGRQLMGEAELYDPTTGTWTATGAMVVKGFARPGVRLQDGDVLVEGGDDGRGSLPAAELFDPNTGTWSSTGSLAGPRWGHTATLLSDGTVLVAGGNDIGRPSSPDGITVASVERYDPMSGTWAAAPAMPTPRMDHTAVLLADGSVLVAGGEQWTPHRWPTATELFRPGSGN